MATTANVVHKIVDALKAFGADPRIAGGWDIDALAGSQSRVHRDLDLAIRADALDASLEARRTMGYDVTTDWLPVRIELSDATGHVDLHRVHHERDGSA